MTTTTKRSSLFLVAALVGTFGLAAPAFAGPAAPATPIIDPLPPPPITPDELQDIAKRLDAELQQRSVGQEQSTPAARPAPGSAPLPPDPTDFASIVADPEDYGIPASAEQFRDGDRYSIPRPTPGGESKGPVPAGLDEFYAQKITWEDCAAFGAPSSLECGYVIVPQDYSQPQGGTVAIAVSRRPATSVTPSGSLLVNPGGPGSPGLELPSAAYFEGLTTTFNIVGFDPRGVGASLPMIRCQSNDAWDRQRQGSDELTGEEFNAVLAYNTNECYAHTGAAFGITDTIDHVGTVNVVKDLDVIRSVLGDSKINYLGFSYGTSIGYEYARQFPDNIRALVLDGSVDVLENNPTERAKYAEYTAGTPADATIAQIAGFQATFEQFLTWCAGLGEECALVDPTGANTPADLLHRYQEIARAAWGANTYATEDGRSLSFMDFTQGTIMAMYASSLWPYLNAGLAEIQTAPTSDFFMMALSDIYAGRDDDGDYSLDLAAFPTIMCTDGGTPEGFNDDPDAQVAFLDDYFAAAPFTDPRTADDPSRGMVASNDWCTYYEEQFTLPPAETLTAMPNILTISTTYDSATPFEQGVVTAAAVGGTLLIAAGSDHTSYGGLECATETTDEYITTLRVPADIAGADAPTKDIYSETVDGTECTVVRDFRPHTELESATGEPGEYITLSATGLVRNSEYVVTWQHGSLAMSSDVAGTGSVTAAIPATAAPGSYPLVLTPGLEGANDPTVRAEATLVITPAGSGSDGGPGDGGATGEGTADGSKDGDTGDTDAEPGIKADPGAADPAADANAPGAEDTSDADELDALPDTPQSELEATGANPRSLLLLGAILLAAGGVAVFIVRRKNGS